MSRVRTLPPDFSHFDELQQKKPRISVDSLMSRFEFVDQEDEEKEEEEEFEDDISEETEEFANNLSESVLDEEEVIEEEDEEDFVNYVSESEVDIHLINEGQQQQRLNPTGGTGARMTARMRVNTDYVHHSIQVSQWVDEEIEEEEVEEDDINEFVDRDMAEYLETRTYDAPPVFADHEEQEACAICLHEYQHGDTIGILQCSHEFHVECINKWFLRKRTCPFCRAQILPTIQL